MQVVFPPGAGGSWLSNLLYYAKNKEGLISNSEINFHSGKQVAIAHSTANLSNVSICIDSKLARYNFWCYYYYKTLLINIRNNQFENECDYDAFDSGNDHARFIHTWSGTGTYNIEWTDLLTNPKRAYEVISKVIALNNNYLSYDQFTKSVHAYIATCKKCKINMDGDKFKFWGIGVLESNGLGPNFSIKENFNQPIMNEYIKDYRDFIIERTTIFNV
jgi:hypothetical protein